MVSKPDSGKILGIPYNFKRPSVGRMLSSYWQPGEGMVVEKPFGIGYTLNLASWRSWIVLFVALAMLWHERQSETQAEEEEESGGGPVEVILDD